MTEEQALVQRARQGDEGAFAALVEQNQGRILKLLYKLSLSHAIGLPTWARVCGDCVI